MGMRVVGCWKIMHFPTPPFSTDFSTGYGIINFVDAVWGQILSLAIAVKLVETGSQAAFRNPVEILTLLMVLAY